MNNLLDLAGHFLYIALRVVLLPVFIALDVFLGAWLMAKFIKKWTLAAFMKASKRQPIQHATFKKSLFLLRPKAIGVTANTH